jgi:hypothetical protein
LGLRQYLSKARSRQIQMHADVGGEMPRTRPISVNGMSRE